MTPKVRDIEDAFFAAMAAGYAQPIPKAALPGLPGSKVIPFTYGDFLILDCYFVTPDSEKSSGITEISYRNKPVWIMHYGGWYSKLAIPFLKQCLRLAYVEKRTFSGGRGPEFVRDGRLTYCNRIEYNCFTDFKGEERIYDTSGQLLGFHWYRGMTMI